MFGGGMNTGMAGGMGMAGGRGKGKGKGKGKGVASKPLVPGMEAEALNKVYAALPESGSLAVPQVGSLLGAGGWAKSYGALGSLLGFVKAHPDQFDVFPDPDPAKGGPMGTTNMLVSRKGAARDLVVIKSGANVIVPGAITAAPTPANVGTSTAEEMLERITTALPMTEFVTLCKFWQGLGGESWPKHHKHLALTLKKFIELHPDKFSLYPSGVDFLVGRAELPAPTFLKPVIKTHQVAAANGTNGAAKPKPAAKPKAIAAPAVDDAAVVKELWDVLPDTGSVMLPQLQEHVQWDAQFAAKAGTILPYILKFPDQFTIANENGEVLVCRAPKSTGVTLKRSGGPIQAPAAKRGRGMGMGMGMGRGMMGRGMMGGGMMPGMMMMPMGMGMGMHAGFGMF